VAVTGDANAGARDILTATRDVHTTTFDSEAAKKDIDYDGVNLEDVFVVVNTSLVIAEVVAQHLKTQIQIHQNIDQDQEGERYNLGLTQFQETCLLSEGV
jgi:hypothetical protein